MFSCVRKSDVYIYLYLKCFILQKYKQIEIFELNYQFVARKFVEATLRIDTRILNGVNCGPKDICINVDWLPQVLELWSKRLDKVFLSKYARRRCKL